MKSPVVATAILLLVSPASALDGEHNPVKGITVSLDENGTSATNR